jgi:hypothetical protein
VGVLGGNRWSSTHRPVLAHTTGPGQLPISTACSTQHVSMPAYLYPKKSPNEHPRPHPPRPMRPVGEKVRALFERFHAGELFEPAQDPQRMGTKGEWQQPAR